MARFASFSIRVWVLALLTTIILILVVVDRDRHVLKPLPTLSSPLSHSNGLDAIGNGTLGFQKIYVISLPSRSDRRDAIALAARLTGLRVTFVDAVTNVSDKALPKDALESKLRPAELGNWRSHMNIARTMIEEDVQSALILEDDADWDIRIKSLMKDFARSAQLLVQPVSNASGTPSYLDPTYPQPNEDSSPADYYVDQHQVIAPTTSPYGDLDNWDLLWLGHCGCRFPQASDVKIPLGRAVLLDDISVPAAQHIDVEYGNMDLMLRYPPHTRVVSHAAVNTCTLGYALSLPGATQLLYHLGIQSLGGTTDMAIRGFCNGEDEPSHPTCLTVQPQLFQHHRPAGSWASLSDISDHDIDGENTMAYTRNIRWSTRVNLPLLVNGSTDYIDSYVDQ